VLVLRFGDRSPAAVREYHQRSRGAREIAFWGVRGSVPWTIPAAIGHGCNTPCLELTDEDSGETLILDARSGLVGLGPTQI